MREQASNRKKTIILFGILAAAYVGIFVLLCQNGFFDVSGSHNDRFFSADEKYYVENFYSTVMDTSSRIIKHPLLIVFAHWFTLAETAVFGSVSALHHYMLIACFQMVCAWLSSVYLFKLLRETYRMTWCDAALLCLLYGAAFSTLFYTFAAESYIFSALVLLMTYYYAQKQSGLITVVLGALAAGITVTNAVLWAVIVLCSGGTWRHRIKVLVGGGLLFCALVAVLPVRQVFYTNIIAGGLNSANNYSDHFGLLETARRVFFVFFGSTFYFIDTTDCSPFGDYAGDALSFVPSGPMIAVILGLIWVIILVCAAANFSSEPLLWAPMAVLAVNLVLHGVIQYGLKEGFLYSLHHMPAQILLVGLLMKKMTKHPIRKRGMQVFLVINLLVVLVLDWVGWDMMLASIR